MTLLRGPDEVFAAERPRLAGLAYRITGSRLDAEDIVQEAWLRCERADWSAIERPEAWLTTVVTRLALDSLQSAARRREAYVGPWLPEPVLTESASPAGDADRADPAEVVELAESLTFGFMRLLESLSPLERVVFILADVFDLPYRDIGAIVDRRPDTCRQIASRARRQVRSQRVRHDPPDDAAQVALRLADAMTSGDVDRVLSLLADDAVLISDGGAAAVAARRPVRGAARVARFLVNLTARFEGRVTSELTVVNNEPGAVVWLDDEPSFAGSVRVEAGVVQGIHIVRNPDKLAALDLTGPLL